MQRILILWIFGAICAFGATCADIEADPKAYFATTPSPSELLLSDYDCKGSLVEASFLRNLQNLARTIRSESIECVGNEASINEKKFERILAQAGMDSDGFLREAKQKNLGAAYANALEILEFYSEQKFINFINFKNFISEINLAKTALQSHFSVNLSPNEASEIADLVLSEFALYAAKNRSIDAYNKLELALKNRVNIDEFNVLLSSNTYSTNDLSGALNLALLLGYDTKFIDALITRGAKINDGDDSALFYAMSNLQNAKFLISKGAQVSHKNQLGQTPIFYAVASKNYEMVNFMVYNHASVNVRQIGSTEKGALASLGGYSDACAFNDLGASLLMYSALHGNKEITELLVKSGADEKRVDEAGLNALDYAIFGGDEKIQEYLKSIGLKPSVSANNGDFMGSMAEENFEDIAN
ncbi:ankyrin repeat domain-containing protein [Campylobacter sp. VBCF_06 NA8]|uniref:ankyrin repeat domain-containing protein n=1 Tax=Campylobacter sp. VBCF_06 NA8 TaxID=2983822 RepID=UPI0022E9FF00|nr:ankyrin repeat domain-containing protein [Campylobacter sp. VBCF_06 NA8]MDA3046930.1 ankyrin repeat domain-containing protein [Campylobacter sp. VBCF_06 NA8]